MLTVNELFSGIGSQSAALKRLGIDFKVVGIAEIDKYAIKSYEAIHGPTRNYGDISKIYKLDYADFWTYSFPCQDISVAGKQAGITEHTRSGLLYQVERLLQVSKDHNELPKYLMLENVKNLIGKKFKAQFDEWLQRLDEFGYSSYWQVLNAKDYGIPQNRERVFAISIRKDLDAGYMFPEPFELKIRLKDILQKEVEEKYYISSDKVNKIINSTFNQERVRIQRTGICDTLLARDYKDPKCVITSEDPKIQQVAQIYPNSGNPQAGRIYSDKGIGPAIDTYQGGNRMPKIIQVGRINSSQDGVVLSPEGISKTHTAGNNNCPKIIKPCIAASRGRNPDNPSDRTQGSPTEQRLEINQNGTSNTITTVQKDNYVLEPQVLRAERTEYGKAIRQAYERGEIQESRHNMTELKPRIDGVSNTLTTVQKDNYVLIPQATKQGYIECNVPGVADLSFPGSKTRRGRVQENGEICPTLMAGQQDLCYIEPSGIYTGVSERFQTGPLQGLSRCLKSEKHDASVIQSDYRIRKLTPLECWRLMGFSDEDFYKAKYYFEADEHIEELTREKMWKILLSDLSEEKKLFHLHNLKIKTKERISNSQLYKQAGNSIVVDVLYYIFKNLFIDKPTVQHINIECQLSGQMNILDFLTI